MSRAMINTPACAGLSDLIEAMIPLADHIMASGSGPLHDLLTAVIEKVADLAIDEGDTREAVRLKARAIRLIYAGDERGLEEGFAEDAMFEGSRSERLAIQILGTLGASKS